MTKDDILPFAKLNKLSPREIDVIYSMLNRFISIKDIAKDLGVSPSTVNNHLNNIFKKTNTSSKAELIICLLHGINEKMQKIAPYKKTPKVLVIDDDENVSNLLMESLSLNGFDCYKTIYPEEALKLLSELSIDFVVSDIRMPRINGVELLRLIREKHKYDPQIIFMTGHSDYSCEQTYDMGAIAMYSKPVNAEVIADTIMEHFVEDLEQRSAFFKDVEPEKNLLKDVTLEKTSVGLGGVFIPIEDSTALCSGALSVGKRIEFNLKVPTEQAPNKVVGEIKWIRQADTDSFKKGIGVKFVNIDEAVRGNIGEFARKNNILSYIPIGQII